MTRIRRLALAATVFCLAAGKAWAPGLEPPIPFRYTGVWDLIFSGLFLLGIIAAVYGIFRLAVRSAKRKYSQETGIAACQVQTPQPWRNTRVIARFVLYLILLAVPAVIVAYIGSLIITILLMLPFIFLFA